MRLFHFSERSDIGRFEPRPVEVPSERKPGMEWLNGPLVWAIDEVHQPLYLFPRDCPRILIWQVEGSTSEDWAAWCGASTARMLAYIEPEWAQRIERECLFRYELPVSGFQTLNDAGMWVSTKVTDPLAIEPVSDLTAALRAQDVELRVLNNLSVLRGVWSSTLHASAIRLRNARSW